MEEGSLSRLPKASMNNMPQHTTAGDDSFLIRMERLGGELKRTSPVRSGKSLKRMLWPFMHEFWKVSHEGYK